MGLAEGDPGPHLADVWFQLTNLSVERGQGAVVVDNHGCEYLDLTSGIGVVNTGHCHPNVVRALQDQASRFIHAQVNCYRHNQLEPLAKRLTEITPAGVDSFFFTNSGAEAVEAAVKLAKQVTGRTEVVVFRGGFHGRTHLTMAMTTAGSGYRAGYQPLPAGVLTAPFPYPFMSGLSQDEAVAMALDEFDQLFRTQTSPENVACVVIEPVLGEGGYVPAPTEFIRGIRERCASLGILFVADEVQTGFGRTGRMFASEHFDFAPDVIVLGKGIASGFPMAAIGASTEVMDAWPKGSHGGTYGGNPLGCAAALATIDVLAEPGFLEDTRRVGRFFFEGLCSVAEAHAGIGENRGLGMMLATEIVDNAGLPSAERAKAIIGHMREESQVLVMLCGPRGSTIRWIPPLILNDIQAERALESFERALVSIIG